MKLINWTNIRLILMFGVVIVLFSFTSHRNGERKLKKSTVVFVGENAIFVKPESVNKFHLKHF